MVRYITLTILLVGMVSMVLFVHPTTPYIIGGFIALTLCTTYVLAIIISGRSGPSALAATGVAGILGMNYVTGFNLINTILLASFIMGVGLIYIHKNE